METRDVFGRQPWGRLFSKRGSSNLPLNRYAARVPFRRVALLAALKREIRPILEKMGKNIFYMGNEGMGEAAKLANNLLLLINMNAAYEAMNLAKKIGLDLNLLRDLINVSTGGSWVMEHWDMVTSWKENYQPDGTLDLIYKDFQLVFQVAQDLKTPLHLGALASQLGRY